MLSFNTTYSYLLRIKIGKNVVKCSLKMKNKRQCLNLLQSCNAFITKTIRQSSCFLLWITQTMIKFTRLFHANNLLYLDCNISSVMEFQRRWVLKSKLFGQKSTCHQEKIFKIMLWVMTVFQKVPKLYFQSQFWISKINRI